ncbi:MAG: hypothetical protein BGO43_06255 [Gammaproteobacteria bacterium 39-13]|nr:MAG: hypothetical protein BGO43_06255 [Gammaproteobacteria bacterium 39-13]
MPWIQRLVIASIGLALCVILLGAYTRLSDAGLGCPDWPGCYGQLKAPSTTEEIYAAHQLYPGAPVDTAKARTEMTHRYAAETLGTFIMIFALLAYWKRREISIPLWLPGLLAVLVLAQGLLGMWTVTMRLLPLVVMSHLLGGFCTLALLWLSWLYLQKKPTFSFSPQRFLLMLGNLSLLMIVLQIILGGWTSANYAALICPDFPTCQGQWLPHFSARAFNFLGGLGLEEPLSYMDSAEKTTIHVMHRLGALLTTILIATLSFSLWREAKKVSSLEAKHWLKNFSFLLAFVLVAQLCLGISNILFHLPLSIAVAHNGVAVLLLLILIALNFTLRAIRVSRG